MRLDRYEAAEDYLLKAVEQGPHLNRPHCNLACLRARQGRLKESFSHLSRAVEQDFGVVRLLKTDADLAALRQDETFGPQLELLIERITSGQEYDRTLE